MESVEVFPGFSPIYTYWIQSTMFGYSAGERTYPQVCLTYDCPIYFRKIGDSTILYLNI